MANEIDIGAYSAYAIAVKHGYQGTEEAWVAAQEKARIDAESAAQNAADAQRAAEEARNQANQSAESAAGSASVAASAAGSASSNAEAAGQYASDALESKTAAENAKTAAQTAESGANTAKNEAVQAKTDAEAAKTASIDAKTGAVNAQKAAESAKEGAESAATNANSAKETAETARSEAVQAKVDAVQAKNDAETALTNVNTAKDDTIKAKEDAVEAQNTSVEARIGAESAKNDAEKAKSDVETMKTEVESARSDAETSKNTAQEAAQTAVNKANEIAASADQIQENTDNIEAITVDTGTLYSAIDNVYQKLVLKATSVQEINDLFADWYNVNSKSPFTKEALLERWFGNVLNDNRVHGVKMPLFSTSTSAVGEFTDDSVGLTCTPSTASVAGQDDFAYLPQFWALEVSMERNMDGSHTINKIEFIDPIEEVRSGENGLCQVLQKNTWSREWKDESYHYMQMTCKPEKIYGWHTWPQGTDKTGRVYAYYANPKYYAGLGSNGIPTCGTGLAPMNWTSHNAGVAAWRKRGAQYSGVSGNLLKWQLAMIWLKYARKGNSGTIEGCSNYNYQYTAAVSETGVKRVILTAAQAGNLLVGSSVQLGVQSGSDRNTASNYSICKNKPILSIEDVTIDNVAYKAVNIGVDAPFDSVAGSTFLSTTPYASGYNDDVLGYDGSRTNYTNGKEPGLIQRTEFQNGSYLILSDELWLWSQDADGNYNFDCYVCHDQSKVTTNGTISANYSKVDGITLVFPSTTNAWWYIEDIAICDDPGVLWPAKVSTSAGSGTGVKAGMYVGTAASGVRAAWCCNSLHAGGVCGLAARASSSGSTDSYWAGSVGVPSGISG